MRRGAVAARPLRVPLPAWPTCARAGDPAPRGGYHLSQRGLAVHVAVGQHHGRVVLVHDLRPHAARRAGQAWSGAGQACSSAGRHAAATLPEEEGYRGTRASHAGAPSSSLRPAATRRGACRRRPNPTPNKPPKNHTHLPGDGADELGVRVLGVGQVGGQAAEGRQVQRVLSAAPVGQAAGRLERRQARLRRQEVGGGVRQAAGRPEQDRGRRQVGQCRAGQRAQDVPWVAAARRQLAHREHRRPAGNPIIPTPTHTAPRTAPAGVPPAATWA